MISLILSPYGFTFSTYSIPFHFLSVSNVLEGSVWWENRGIIPVVELFDVF